MCAATRIALLTGFALVSISPPFARAQGSEEDLVPPSPGDGMPMEPAVEPAEVPAPERPDHEPNNVAARVLAPRAVPGPTRGAPDDNNDQSGERIETREPPIQRALDPDSTGDRFRSGFAFGSYGRVVASSNLDGGLGRESDIVAFNPRIDEDVYFELELRRQDQFDDGLRSFVVATLAFGGPFFHLDGNFDESVAVRNLFAMVQNALADGLSLWAGSRMWRGDDVYLLNFWPLDNLNLLGGGADYDFLSGNRAQLRLAVGLARRDDPFQRQVGTTIAPNGFLPAEVIILDRPRVTVAAKATYWLFGRSARNGIKASLYGEGHFLPSGQREVDGGGIELLPRDSGYMLGAQIGLYSADSNTFVNLFARYARGLAVYDPLGVPFREGAVQDTARAREIMLALSGNIERGMVGLQVGAYYRNFRDADPNVFDRAHLAEGAIVLRPHLFFGDHAGLSFEASYQAMQASALDERTGQVVRGGVTKIGFIPFYSPFGRGTYTRPHLRLIYSITIRDEDARRLYPDADPRSQQSVEHFLGIGAEWWFDSSSYGT